MKKMWKKIMMKIRNNNFSNKSMKWSKNVNHKLNRMRKSLILREIKEEIMKRAFFS
jgi:ketol-acid reductoisomerase